MSNQPRDLNTLLTDLNQPIRSLQDIPRHVETCRQALELIDRNQQPELWAALQVELGNNLDQDPHGNRAENIEQAIHHYNQALEVHTQEDFPEQWKEIQSRLKELAQ
jgi:hypothetical protein